MLGVTLVPTRARASGKDNVIPSRAEVLVDCRVPPGMGEAERATGVLERPRRVADDYELEFVEHAAATARRPTLRSPR